MQHYPLEEPLHQMVVVVPVQLPANGEHFECLKIDVLEQVVCHHYTAASNLTDIREDIQGSFSCSMFGCEE